MSGALDVTGSVREFDGETTRFRVGFRVREVDCERFRRSIGEYGGNEGRE